MCKIRKYVAILFLCACAGATAQTRPPTIFDLRNAYGIAPSGMAGNFAIAQGSIFRIVGSALAAEKARQDVPLTTSLAGATVTISVSGVTVQALIYSASPTQIIAVLPSATPVGDGTMTVSSGGQSRTGPFHVVRSSFGLLAHADITAASAIVRSNSQKGELLSFTSSANPGDSIALWGSGLGPTPGGESQYQPQIDLSSIPVRVEIGGVSAAVTYRGRSIYPGLDQINVIVPPGVSGCYVSIAVVVAGRPSNFATIPIASSGRVCSDDSSLSPVKPDDYRQLSSLASANIGTVSLAKLTTAGADADSASGLFQAYTPERLQGSDFLQQPSLGSCLVVPGIATPLDEWHFYSRLDAGPQVNIVGPGGGLTLNKYAGGGWYNEPPGTSPSFIPSAGGTFTISNGSGGPNVGAFQSSLGAALSTPFTWTNADAVGSVRRDSDLTVSWTGGLPGSFVSIFGSSYIHQGCPLNNGCDVYVSFVCSAPVSAGRVQVPASVLSSLLPAANGRLWVINKIFRRFEAPGLDLGLSSFSVGRGISVPFE